MRAINQWPRRGTLNGRLCIYKAFHLVTCHCAGKVCLVLAYVFHVGSQTFRVYSHHRHSVTFKSQNFDSSTDTFYETAQTTHRTFPNAMSTFRTQHKLRTTHWLPILVPSVQSRRVFYQKRQHVTYNSATVRAATPIDELPSFHWRSADSLTRQKVRQ